MIYPKRYLCSEKQNGKNFIAADHPGEIFFKRPFYPNKPGCSRRII
jgi:hypothetical protein